MTDGELDELIAQIADAVKRIRKVCDPRQRAKLAHRLVRSVHAASVELGPVRQDALRSIRASEEAAGRQWRHRDTARLLDADIVVAGRIMNAKLKRQDQPDSQDGPSIDDREHDQD